jgi:SPP1 gp7 family putative phage head morphogenesis protein
VIRTVVLEQLHAVRHDDDRADGFLGSQIRALAVRIRAALSATLPVAPASLAPLAQQVDAAVSSAVVADLEAQLPGVDLGALLRAGTSATRASVAAWTRETATRIAEAEARLVDIAIEAAATAADAGEDPVAAATGVLGPAEVRAALTARDATGDLVAAVTEVRATQLGARSYVWRTQQDAHVRPAHQQREGRVFRWDDPPEDGAPGEPFGCRCWAEAVAPGAAPTPAPPPSPFANVAHLDLFGGASASEAARVIALALGRPFSPADVVRWAGVEGRAVASIAMRLDGPNRIGLSISGPGISLERSYSLRSSGLYAYHEFFRLDARGQGAGRAIFARQVEALRAAGFTGIGTKAAGGPGQPLVGYYVWPRLGFDGALPAGLRLPAELAPAVRVSDLMGSEAGRDWWRANGQAIEIAFDLSPGSLSSRVFSAYLSEIRTDRADAAEAPSAPIGDEFVRLTLSDEAALDRAWAAVRARGVP